jgi:hypothetical protein
MATDAQSLATYGQMYASQPGVQGANLLKLALLQQIAAIVAPTVQTDTQSLVSAANVAGYSSAGFPGMAALLELALLQIIANNVGGGSSSAATFGNYAGGQPTFTPSSGTGLAVDTSDGTMWEYYSGAWH